MPLPKLDQQKIKERIEALAVLKTMRAGAVTTESHIKALRVFFGPVLDKLKPVTAIIESEKC